MEAPGDREAGRLLWPWDKGEEVVLQVPVRTRAVKEKLPDGAMASKRSPEQGGGNTLASLSSHLPVSC